MFRKHLTLLIIPEEGGNTHEFKVPRIVLWFLGLCGVGFTVLFSVGLYGYSQARDLEEVVLRLQREKSLLEAEVDQVDQLEQVLTRLQRSNDQLRAILGGSGEGESLQGNAGSADPDISSLRRLHWGYVESVPTAWPLAGPIARTFSERFPAVVIVAAEGTPVCAGASGRVRRAGYDERLGQMLVIDHGNGIETYYGYNSYLMVAEGEYVLKGQSIALSGRSGASAQEGLYYALKEGGRFCDPARYRLWL
ncbi:MAG: murein hydrolase activator EnvC family protein [Candidatus Latescibacterota bacterium]|jgi:murein DD-endopeptidase MepM/ murein hydrolase activator NlpD